MMERIVENIKSRGAYSSVMSYLLCRIGFSLNFFGQSLHLCGDSHHLKLIQIKPLIRIHQVISVSCEVQKLNNAT